MGTRAAICHLGPRPSLPCGLLSSLRNSSALRLASEVTARSLGGRGWGLWGGVHSPGFQSRAEGRMRPQRKVGMEKAPRQGKLAGSLRKIWASGLAAQGAPSPKPPRPSACPCWAVIEARAFLPDPAPRIRGRGVDSGKKFRESGILILGGGRPNTPRTGRGQDRVACAACRSPASLESRMGGWRNLVPHQTPLHRPIPRPGSTPKARFVPRASTAARVPGTPGRRGSQEIQDGGAGASRPVPGSAAGWAGPRGEGAAGRGGRPGR